MGGGRGVAAFLDVHRIFFSENSENKGSNDPMPVISLKYILENNPFVEIDVEEEDSDMDTDI